MRRAHVAHVPGAGSWGKKPRSDGFGKPTDFTKFHLQMHHGQDVTRSCIEVLSTTVYLSYVTCPHLLYNVIPLGYHVRCCVLPLAKSYDLGAFRYHKPGGCKNGQECGHCHLCPDGEIKAQSFPEKIWSTAL